MKLNIYIPTYCLILSSFILISVNSLSQESDEIKYDFSNFEPYTAEQFIDSYFSTLKECYDRDPNSIVTGIQIIQNPVPEGSRYKRTVSVIQLYSGLLDNAVLEWAHSNGYDVGSAIYTEGYSIYKRWGDIQSPSISFNRHFLFTSADKTIEEDFRKQNHSQNQYERRLSGGVVASHRISSLNGVLSSETESLSISKTRDDAMRAQGIMKPDKEASKSAWVDYVASNSNNYSASIVLMDSKYGSWSGSSGKHDETNSVSGSIIPIRDMMGSALVFCGAKIAEVQALFYKRIGVDYVDPNIEKLGTEIVVEVSAAGYITETRALSKRDLEASDILLSGVITDKSGALIEGAQIKLRGIDGAAESDDAGIYNLIAKAKGKEAHSETMNIKLSKIGIEISNDELGEYGEEPFGIVSDGFTTLILKVKASGIRPQTVVVKSPILGNFIEQSFLKLPLILDADGVGEMEYVPPAYLKDEDLSSVVTLTENTANKYGLENQIWVAEVPIEITYEDEDGNPGSFVMKILITRPPVLLIHGFTGDSTTWADLGKYLRARKYESIINEYYKGPADESTIERQSQKIEAYIQELQQAYLDNGIIQTRVDIVAHSMGGLMSRHYISNMARYGEKAGIYIPYNVKLLRDELAAARNKTTVKLIDIRKLIMVGTPNHGATWIDEQIGALSADDVNAHEVANSQLRSNSQFLSNLNADESEGRHLDQNVQYALLYGIRRVSPLYPADLLANNIHNANALIDRPLAFNDGVVAVSSAKLNGVIDFRFPQEIDHYNNSFIYNSIAPNGFIHSPAIQMFFGGDKSITTSEEIFTKVNELLLEDIPRVALKNSYARVTSNHGESYMRYYATDEWNPMAEDANIKLENRWCQFKTDEGRIRLGFFLDGHHWASIYIMSNSIVYIENVSSEFVKVYLQEGRARFSSRKQDGGGFEVVMGREGEKWYNFNPKAKVTDLNTDFIIEEGESLNVQSIDGDVSIEVINKKEINIIAISTNEGVLVEENGEVKDNPLPETGWWSSIDTSYLKDEIIEKTLSVVYLSGSDSLDTIQRLGEVDILSKHEYLPISGFTDLQINAKTDVGDILKTPYEVVISLRQPELLSFINITNPVGLIDETGSYITNINISEPNIKYYSSLEEIPLSASFLIKINNPQTHENMFEEELVIPIGMTLLMGQTIGSDYKPRPQLMPPEFHNTSYQIANGADGEGNFFMLFNTTKYEQDSEKFKKFAQRTNEEFSLDNFDFYIEWSEANLRQLKYYINDSTKTKLKAGRKVKVGNNGFIDLLSPEEHELRIKYLVKEFIVDMPLKPDYKTVVLNKLDSLFIRYNTNSFESPGFNDNLIFSNVIYAPKSKNDYWSNVFVKEEDYPSFTMIMHVMGHFLQQTICLQNHRYYDFLSDKCSVSERLGLQQASSGEPLFGEAEYISFSEASADFFTYLMLKYIEINEKDMLNKSIYFNPGYLDQIEANNTVDANKQISKSFNIAGLQTSFLIDYYRDKCTYTPVKVYTDFLFNQYEYSITSKSGHPAATINEWLSAKQSTYKDYYFVRAENPTTLANEYKLKYASDKACLIPGLDFLIASVEIDGNIISDFSQIPLVNIDTNTIIKIVNGHFTLLIPIENTKYIVKIKTGSEIKIGLNNVIELLYGNFRFKTSAVFQTSLARFVANSSDFEISIEPKSTIISVYDGELIVTSENDEETILSGEFSSMNKKGKIKKPKEIENSTHEPVTLKTETPFLIN